MQEKTLLEKARQFDETALAEIYDSYSSAIYRYAYRLLGDVDKAEECVSETFYRFLNALKKEKGAQMNLKAYLYRIAHNWITDQFRHQPQPYLELNENYAQEEEENPSTKAIANIEQEQIRAIICKLTPDQQQVIMLKYLEDMNNEEVSQIMKKPVGAVKSLQHRALTNLQRILSRAEVVI